MLFGASSSRFLTRWVPLTVGAIMLVCLVNVCRGDGYPDEPFYPPQPKRGGLVDVDVRDTEMGGKHVGVHVPVFYKMDLDKDHYRGTGLGINVLEGLVKVRVKKDPFKIKDNVFVSVAGIPMWMQR